VKKLFFVCCFVLLSLNITSPLIQDSVTLPIYQELTIESLTNYLRLNGIEDPFPIVQQAIHETGWFRSRACLEYNNLFGMQALSGGLAIYRDWKESVEAYCSWLQRRIKEGHLIEDYYTFLIAVHYAEDPLYIKKLKGIKLESVGIFDIDQ
jgi:hypothetical protein